MPEHTGVGTSYARAIAHPVRVGIVAGLAGGPRTAASLAREIDATEATVGRHARALEALGLLESRAEEGRPRTYELLREPILWDEDWDSLPLPAKRSAAASILTQVQAQAAAAVDAGGFDRHDMHLSRTSLRVTDELWEETAARLRETLEDLGKLSEKAEADTSPDPRTQATAVLMLFTGEHTESAPADEPAPEFGEDEAHERSYALVDALEREVAAPAASWERVEALAEQLRLIARAAMSFEDAAKRPAARQPELER